MDARAEALAKELVRAWRGRRSQRGLSHHLGYASNVVNAWEAGRRWPTASDALAVARRLGHDPDEAVLRFLKLRPDWLGTVDLATPAGVVVLLAELRGSKVPIKALAERTGASRFAVSRWLSGAAEPRLPELLALVEACTSRALDWMAGLADPRRMPSVLAAREAARKRMELIDRQPWTQAVFAALTLHGYAALPDHDDAWIADRLGVSPAVVAGCLEQLAATGQIRRSGPRWEHVRETTQDTVEDPAAGRRLKAFWAEVGGERVVRAGPDDLFSFFLFAISEEDHRRLRELHVEYFRSVWSVVARSDRPPDRVVLANVQLFSLGSDGPEPIGRAGGAGGG